MAAVFSSANHSGLMSQLSGCPGEHKPLNYAELTCRSPNFGKFGAMGGVLVVFRS